MLFYMLVHRTLWLIRLRWMVPPALCLGAFLASRLGFGFHSEWILQVALCILLYNLVFWFLRRRVAHGKLPVVTAFTFLQVGVDYAALFCFIHLTGGAYSPVAVFLLFHILLAAILLPAWGAWLAAVVSVLGLFGVGLLEQTGVWARQEITYLGAPLFRSDEPMLALLNVLVFATAAFITAFLSTAIMRVLRRRIVELAESHEAIQRISDERDQFMLQVTHNLRAPLTTSLSLIDTLDADFLGSLNEKQKSYVQRVRARVQGLLDTVGELLTLARNKNGVRRLDPRPVDLLRLARQTHQNYLERATQKGLSLELCVPVEGALWVLGEDDQLEQVLENLVSNAVKYTILGQVTLTLREARSHQVEIEVRDTGIGISEKDKSHLFSEFFRGRNAKQLQVVGTGLGLALVKQSVGQLGGEVSVHSEEGKGTVFTVLLPLGSAPAGSNGAGN